MDARATVARAIICTAGYITFSSLTSGYEVNMDLLTIPQMVMFFFTSQFTSVKIFEERELKKFRRSTMQRFPLDNSDNQIKQEQKSQHNTDSITSIISANNNNRGKVDNLLFALPKPAEQQQRPISKFSTLNHGYILFFHFFY